MTEPHPLVREMEERLRQQAEAILKLDHRQQELVKQLAFKEAELAALSLVDAQTGLQSRRSLMLRLDDEMRVARRFKRTFSALAIEADAFLDLCVQQGEPAGISLLQEAARQVRSLVRDVDLLCRDEGGKLLLFLPETSRDGSLHLADKIRRHFADRDSLVGGVLRKVTLSIGAAAWDPRDRGPEAFLARAGRALARACEAGRNRVCEWTADDAPVRMTTQALQAQRPVLEQIIRHEQIRPFYQKIVEMDNREPIGYEMLSRGPAGTPYESPDPLFGLARDLDLLPELDWVCFLRCLEEGLNQVKQGLVFVNVYPSMLPRLGRLKDERCRGLMAAAAGKLVVEISEREAIRDYREIRELTAILRERGILVALDDVGAGHASIETLIRVRPDFVKLEGMLAQESWKDLDKFEIVRTIHDSARRIGSRAIAEGVETEAEARVLREIGIQFGQGYLYARPTPVLPEEGERAASARSLFPMVYWLP